MRASPASAAFDGSRAEFVGARLSHAAAMAFARRNRAAFVALTVVLVLTILFQRLAYHTNAGPISIMAAAYPLFILWFATTSKIEIDRTSLFFVLMFYVGTYVSLTMVPDFISTSAYMALFIYTLSIFFIRINDCYFSKWLDFIAFSIVAITTLIVIQFFAQFVIGAEYVFSLAWLIPADFLLEYNVFARISWGVDVFRSSGFFFVEPSAASQYLAKACVILILFRPADYRIWIGVMGIITTLSGTGLLILLLFLFFYAVFEPRTTMTLIFGNSLASISLRVFALIGFVFFISPYLDLNLFVARTEEFWDTNSSGFARIISPFVVAYYTYDSTTITPFLFGHGAGRVEDHMNNFGFNTFATCWFKILYEYGVIGLTAIMGVMLRVFWRATLSLPATATFFFHFFFMDGIFVNAQHVTLTLVLTGLVLCPLALQRWRSNASPAGVGASP